MAGEASTAEAFADPVRRFRLLAAAVAAGSSAGTAISLLAGAISRHRATGTATDHPRPPMQTHRGASQSLQLSASLSEELLAMSQREHVTLFMLLLAAFQVLLSRYSGQQDIAIGTDIANRTRNESKDSSAFLSTRWCCAARSRGPKFSPVPGTGTGNSAGSLCPSRCAL